MYMNILVPLDSSELSEISLEHVKKIAAGETKPDVTLLIVLEHISYLAFASRANLSDDSILRIERESQVRAREYIDAVINKLKQGGISARGEVLWGQPAEEILRYAKEKQIDLVVMSAHGRSGIQRWAFGSVADKVIRYSPIPILIIPPHGRSSGK